MGNNIFQTPAYWQDQIVKEDARRGEGKYWSRFTNLPDIRRDQLEDALRQNLGFRVSQVRASEGGYLVEVRSEEDQQRILQLHGGNIMGRIFQVSRANVRMTGSEIFKWIKGRLILEEETQTQREIHGDYRNMPAVEHGVSQHGIRGVQREKLREWKRRNSQVDVRGKSPVREPERGQQGADTKTVASHKANEGTSGKGHAQQGQGKVKGEEYWEGQGPWQGGVDQWGGQWVYQQGGKGNQGSWNGQGRGQGNRRGQGNLAWAGELAR